MQLTICLAKDPSSQVAAALAGWEHPFSYEAILLAQILDEFAVAHLPAEKAELYRPWPRPWPSQAKGKVNQVSHRQARATLASLGH